MPNPFSAIQGAFGSFADFIGNNLHEYQLYQRYGPQYRDVMDRMQRQDQAQYMADLELVNNRRTRTAINEQSLDTEQERTRGFELDNFQKETDILSRAQEAGIDFNPDDFGGNRDAAMREFLRVGGSGIADAEAAQSELTRERKRDFEDMEEVRKNDGAKKRIDEIQSRIDENLAQAQSADALTRQRDARADSISNRQGRAPGTGGGSAPHGATNPTTAAQRNALVLAMANDMLITEGAHELDVVDELGPLPYQSINEIPADRLQRAIKRANEFSGQSNLVTFREGQVELDEQGQLRGQIGGANTFEVRVPSASGVGSEGQVFRDRDERIESRIQQKIQNGEPLTSFEQAYIDAVAEKFGQR